MTGQPPSSSDPLDQRSAIALGPAAMLRKRILPWVQVVGLLMLGLAVYMVVRQHDASGRNLLVAAWDSLRSAPAWKIAAVALLPATNWIFVTLLFGVLIRQRAPHVRFGEMAAVIGSAWLLNIIPGRPGLMGRVAYHTAVNKVPVKESVRIIVIGLVSNAVALALALLLVAAGWLAAQMLPRELAAEATAKFLVLGAAATLSLLISFAWLQRGKPPRPGAPVEPWRFGFAVAVRYADYTVWVLRYWLAFDVIGTPISLSEAAGIAVVSQIIQLSPAQLGIREWAVGVAGTALPSLRSLSSVGKGPATGLTADLLCRAAELAVQLPVGLVCTWWVLRRVRAATRGGNRPASGAGRSA